MVATPTQDPGEALVREILQSPDDDAPRIVYADWLEQRGDAESCARAELIRTQCELEHATKRGVRTALRERADAVLRVYGDLWTEPLRDAGIGTRWKFRRGFVDHGTLAATKFVKIAERMFELAPTLRAFRFPEASNELNGLAACPELAHVVHADLHALCNCGHCRIERELPNLFASPHARNLLTLDLSECRMDADNAERLASSDALAQLRTLRLTWNRIGNAGAGAFARTTLGALRELSLRGNEIGPAGAVALAGSTQLGALRVLDLSNNKIKTAGARAIADSPWMTGLERLDLRANDIGAKAADTLRARFGKRIRL